MGNSISLIVWALFVTAGVVLAWIGLKAQRHAEVPGGRRGHLGGFAGRGEGDGDMTDQEHLEQAYWRLLAWYPREFRDEHGPEILAVLMAGAPDGRRRPGLAGSVDLIRSGLWLRLRPSVPRSARTVRAAVKLIYAGAAVSTVNLVILLALIADVKAYHAILGHHLTTAQVSQASTPFITTVILWDLVPIAGWLWMARACGRGRNWARVVSTVLFGLATLNLTGAFNWFSGIHLSLVPMIYGPALPVLYWLAGAAVVWLLWRPGSRAYFRPRGYTQAQHQAQMDEFDHEAQMDELARFRARLPRQV
jgi:hypothetical protein